MRIGSHGETPNLPPIAEGRQLKVSKLKRTPDFRKMHDCSELPGVFGPLASCPGLLATHRRSRRKLRVGHSWSSNLVFPRVDRRRRVRRDKALRVRSQSGLVESSRGSARSISVRGWRRARPPSAEVRKPPLRRLRTLPCERIEEQSLLEVPTASTVLTVAPFARAPITLLEPLESLLWFSDTSHGGSKAVEGQLNSSLTRSYSARSEGFEPPTF